MLTLFLFLPVPLLILFLLTIYYFFGRSGFLYGSYCTSEYDCFMQRRIEGRIVKKWRFVSAKIPNEVIWTAVLLSIYTKKLHNTMKNLYYYKIIANPFLCFLAVFSFSNHEIIIFTIIIAGRRSTTAGRWWSLLGGWNRNRRPMVHGSNIGINTSRNAIHIFVMTGFRDDLNILPL